MFRWKNAELDSLYYREPFKAEKSIVIPNKDLELDHYAYIHLGSELEMYKILDTNFIDFIEQRGDISRLKNIKIPVEV